MKTTYKLAQSLKESNSILIFSLIILIFTLFSGIIIYFASIQFSRKEVDTIIARMHEDIRYINDRWDLFYLDSDPVLPGSNPHYILSTDGYVIERWRSIDGFLDTSDIDYILRFQTAQTVTAPTQEQWRVLSRPIKKDEELMGAVFVSRFITEDDSLETIDKKLLKDLNFVINKIKVRDDRIDISDLDMRETQYDISIKIVDKYNTIIAKTNNSNSKDRAPNYIDKSYILRELNAKKARIIRDTTTNEPFLMVSSQIFNQEKEPVGLIIVGKSLAFLEELLRTYILSVLALTVLLLPLLWYLSFLKKHKVLTQQIHFDEKKSVIMIDKIAIEIPTDTHQYHLLYCLFKNPLKPLSAEKIASHFGEHEGNIWRRVYDAMLLVNKKVEPYIFGKLLIIKNKNFMLNPQYLSNIQSH